MATLTKSTGTVTLTGAVEKVTLPAVYGWVWVKNMSEGDILAGLSADISEGADGVMTIPAGECGRIQTDGFNSIYLMGTGNALVVAQNYADCPFKLGAKGGEIPDLSMYAKKTDIPTELPANGGNADTLDNLHAISFALKTEIPTTLPANGGNADTVNSLRTDAVYYDIFSTTLNDSHPCWNKICYVTGVSNDPNSESYIDNAPEISNALWYEVETVGSNTRAYQIAHGCYIHQRKSFIRYMHDAVWSDWFEIYTSNSKPYVTGTLSEQASDSPVTMSFTIFDFTPSKVICQFGNGNAFFANVVTNGFSLTIPAGTTTIHYIAFK